MVLGVISDGDVRRAVLNKQFDVTADEIMTRAPVMARESDRLEDLLEVMEQPKRKIYAVPIVDEAGRLMGAVRMHDVLGS